MNQHGLTGSLSSQPAAEDRIPQPGGGGPPGPQGPVAPPISNAHLAMAIFIGAELMLFTGLMGAHVFLRYGGSEWPPAGQPRLAVAATAANSVALLLSALTMRGAWAGFRSGSRRRLRRNLALTAGLGAVFLALQGREWLRLVAHGLSLGSAYGSTFAALIGLHGLHVLGAVAWLLLVLWKSARWRYSARRHVEAELCAMYWMFVCGLWILLFGLVYLG